tara:strand:+ start:279 stop:461 length:183 start_codon:yes stop_codon:yes gene_type:complete
MMRLKFSKKFDDIKTGKGKRYTFWNEFNNMISKKEKFPEFPQLKKKTMSLSTYSQTLESL